MPGEDDFRITWGQVLIFVASVLAGMAVWQASSGLTRHELAYIPDAFPIVRRQDKARYGEHRTKRLVLEALENLDLVTARS